MADETPRTDDTQPDEQVRSLARDLKTKYGSVDPLVLEADDAFLAAVGLLEGVDDEAVALLARDSGPFAAAIGCEAIRRRRSAPAGWEKKALRRLGQASPGEVPFHLRALAAAARHPVIPRVLAAVRQEWLEGAAREAVGELLTARIAAGERIDPGTLANQLEGVDVSLVAAVVDAAEEPARSTVIEALGAWRRQLLDPEFFETFARFVDPRPDEEPILVGQREAVVTSLVSAVEARQSVVLVGEHGVGKSTLVREILRRLGPDWVAIEAGASDVMAGQSFIGELEGRIQEIAQRAAGQPLVWVFPRLEEAIWSGQHFRSPRGLFDALLPHVEARRLVVIGELDPSAYETAVQLRPRIKTSFEPIHVNPLTESETLQVCDAVLGRSGPKVSQQTLREAHELALHYLPGAAPPGGALRLLTVALDRRRRLGSSGAIGGEDLLATLSEATGLPLHVLDPRAPLDLEALRSFFTDRVLGQPEAVQTLVERIAMIKAGLTDPTRPLGVFLFVGPTGTGKTEIAKALAEYLFGSPDKLVRVDMSEYQTPEGFDRLLGESSSGDAHGPTLASSVRKDPFSVVLLDEFEKAHPNVWNLFLQVFDDGRLTDSAGRTADFRHCVIILTSNIGSAIPTRPGLGFAGEERGFEAEAVQKELEASFRPELLNRLDRVVVFRPLDRSVMRAIVEKELRAVLERRGFRIQPWAVEWDDAAVDFLLERGFSETFGARPLKRAVEQYLLAPLAMAIVGGRLPEGDQFLFITASGDRIDVTFVGPDDEPEKPLPAAKVAPERLEPLISEPRGDLGEIAFLEERMRSLRARIGAGEWEREKEDGLEATRDPAFWESEGHHDVLGRIEYLDRIEAAMSTAEGLLRRLDRGGRNGRPTKLIRLLAERVYLLDRALAGLDAGDAADAQIRIDAAAGAEAQAEAEDFVRELGEMYTAWAGRRGMRIERLDESGSGRQVYGVSGIAAYTILRPETGLHVLELPEGHRSYSRVGAYVTVNPSPANGSEAGASGSPTVVRRYRREPSPLVRDSIRGWRTGRLDRVLAGEFDVLT